MKPNNIVENKKTDKIWLHTGIFFIIIACLCTYEIWQSYFSNWTITIGGGNFSQAFIKSEGIYAITYLNQESLYISFLSVLFSFLGNKEVLVPIFNLILQISGLILLHIGIKKMFRPVLSLIITIISGVLSAYFYPVISDSSMHIIWFFSCFLLWFGFLSFGEVSVKLIRRIFLGILLGIACYVDLAGIVMLVTFILLILAGKELSFKEKGISILKFFVFLICVISGYFVMFYLWNNLCFDYNILQYWLDNKVNFWYDFEYFYQYVVVIAICAICWICYLGISLKKPRTSVDNNEIPKETKNLLGEIILEECVINDIEDAPIEEPKQKQIKFIENPLPLPKKHVKKEMNYAFEPTPEQMHYDLNNYQMDDDYDLNDI